ncbi:MAG: conjugal transfer protein TraC, partial [Pseudonocardiaceae bacterium]
MTLRRNRRRAKAAVDLRAAGASSASAFIPDSLSIGARHLEVGTEWVASFAVVGFPREVNAGWLAPLLTYPARLDVSVHV